MFGLGHFTPRAGQKTKCGKTLVENPSINDPDVIRLAALADARIADSRHCMKLNNFLPPEIRVVALPDSKRNCFGFVLGMSESPDRYEFMERIQKLGFVRSHRLSKNQPDVLNGDILLYYRSVFDGQPGHAAIGVSAGRVQAAWGQKGAIVEHPADVFYPGYVNQSMDGFVLVYRKEV